MPIDDDGYFSGDFSITWNAAAAPDLINLGSIGKTESDLYDIKIEASGLGQVARQGESHHHLLLAGRLDERPH